MILFSKAFDNFNEYDLERSLNSYMTVFNARWITLHPLTMFLLCIKRLLLRHSNKSAPAYDRGWWISINDRSIVYSGVSLAVESSTAAKRNGFILSVLLTHQILYKIFIYIVHRTDDAISIRYVYSLFVLIFLIPKANRPLSRQRITSENSKKFSKHFIDLTSIHLI